MHQKIRQEHHLNVPRDVVYATMTGWKVELWGQGRKRGNFMTKGVDWVHCKFMGYQRFTSPLAVYGCMDTENYFGASMDR